MTASISDIEPVVFAYNFPHKKTQDFLLRLVLLDWSPRIVLLADPVKLQIPPPAIRVKPRHTGLVHPREVCERFQIPYMVVDHNGPECIEVLRSYKPDIGVVAGARILCREVIRCFSTGIVNFHPGLIPEVRGLDALQWAIYHDLSIVVTSHLIDHRVDAGCIIERMIIDEFPDDTLIDLSLRLYERQVAMLSTTLVKVATTDKSELEVVSGGDYRRPFCRELVPELHKRLEKRLARAAKAA